MHGTHVTGIAAGDGSARGNEGQAAFTFVGVAPEADIIVVANRSGGSEGIGTSSNTLDAVNYIFQRAGTMSKPVVVNMSLGDNLGPHDGTSLLERGLDNLLGAAGRAFVKSAGNAGAAQIHASGNVATNTTVEVAFQSPPDNDTPDQIDVWYDGCRPVQGVSGRSGQQGYGRRRRRRRPELPAPGRQHRADRSSRPRFAE